MVARSPPPTDNFKNLSLSVMFRLEHPEYVIYLLALLAVWGIWWLGRWNQKRRSARLGDMAGLGRISFIRQRSEHWLRPTLTSAAVILAVVAMVNPQWGRKKEKVTIESSDVVIALDLSMSMMATDVKPSRLERARLFADRLVDRLKGERIALVLFANGAYTQVPLTTDYAAIKLFLSSAEPQLVPSQGTNFAEALQVSLQTFPAEERRPGTVILITDGEGHEEGDIEATRTLRELGYRVYTVGVGTAQGSQIPVIFRGRRDVKRDETGAPVISKLDRETLVRLANNGGGKAFLIGEGERVFNILSEDIANMEKTESEQLSFAEYVSYYQYFLVGSIVFLILAYLLPFGKMFRPVNESSLENQ